MATSSASNEPYLLAPAEPSSHSRFGRSKKSRKVFVGTSSDWETLNGGKLEVEFHDLPGLPVSYPIASLFFLLTAISHKCNCSSCGNDIRGIKWSCKDCNWHFHLCTRCYHADKHYKKHQFERIDFPGEKGVLVGTRDRAEKLEVHGYKNIPELETGMVYLYHLPNLEKYKDNFCRPGPTVSGVENAAKNKLQDFPVEFFGAPLSLLLEPAVRDVVLHCEEFRSYFRMSESDERWASRNTYTVLREFFRRLAKKGKPAQDKFFESFTRDLKTVNKDTYIALLNARDIVIRRCPEEVVDIVSQEISRSWKKIARKLGIKEGKINAIQVEEAEADERTRLVLRLWRESKGSDATTRDIMFALTAVGCAQVNLIIMEELNLIPNRQSSNIR